MYRLFCTSFDQAQSTPPWSSSFLLIVIRRDWRRSPVLGSGLMDSSGFQTLYISMLSCLITPCCVTNAASSVFSNVSLVFLFWLRSKGWSVPRQVKYFLILLLPLVWCCFDVSSMVVSSDHPFSLMYFCPHSQSISQLQFFVCVVSLVRVRWLL